MIGVKKELERRRGQKVSFFLFLSSLVRLQG